MSGGVGKVDRLKQGEKGRRERVEFPSEMMSVSNLDSLERSIGASVSYFPSYSLRLHPRISHVVKYLTFQRNYEYLKPVMS